MIPTAEQWVAEAHWDDGKHFIVRADEKLTAFLELKSEVIPDLMGRNREGQR